MPPTRSCGRCPPWCSSGQYAPPTAPSTASSVVVVLDQHARSLTLDKSHESFTFSYGCSQSDAHAIRIRYKSMIRCRSRSVEVTYLHTYLYLMFSSRHRSPRPASYFFLRHRLAFFPFFTRSPNLVGSVSSTLFAPVNVLVLNIIQLTSLSSSSTACCFNT